MIDAQKLAEHAGFSKFHQRQLRFLIARLARLAYSDGLEDAARECELAEPIEPTMDALAAAIRAMKTANAKVSGAGTASAGLTGYAFLEIEMARTFEKDHPEQIAYENTCSMWLTEGTSDREKYAYRDGHHAGWRNAEKEMKTLLADIKTWDVSTYLTLPLELRQRIERVVGSA